MWIGSSGWEDIFRQKVRPSEEETRQPLVTFQSSFSSSVLDGSMGLSSCIPRGNIPGDCPTAMGLWRPAGLLLDSWMLGE